MEGARMEGVASPVTSAVEEDAREPPAVAVWEERALPGAEALTLPQVVVLSLSEALVDVLALPVTPAPLCEGRKVAVCAAVVERISLRDGAVVDVAGAEGEGGAVERGVFEASAEIEPLPLLLPLPRGESDEAALPEEECDARGDRDAALLPVGERDAMGEALPTRLRLSRGESVGLPIAEREPRGDCVFESAPLPLAVRVVSPLPDCAAVAEEGGDCDAVPESKAVGGDEGLPDAE